jgi:hypothetical protein
MTQCFCAACGAIGACNEIHNAIQNIAFPPFLFAKILLKDFLRTLLAAYRLVVCGQHQVLYRLTDEAPVYDRDYKPVVALAFDRLAVWRGASHRLHRERVAAH